MSTSEIVINEYLGAELRGKRVSWQKTGIIVSENTEAFVAKGQRPDLIVCDNPMAPVGIETEFLPANTVESDARARLGQVYVRTGGRIHSVVALRLPAKYRKLSGLAIAKALAKDQQFEYCLLTGQSATEHQRWPATGFITGSIGDLADVVEKAKVSPTSVAQGATILEEGAKVLAAMLESSAVSHPKLASDISNYLKQAPGPQTFAMAATILVSAFVFQETLAGTSKALMGISSIYQLGSGQGQPTKSEVMKEWTKILKVNYWPIFGIARSLISVVPADIWASFSTSCLDTADRLLSLNLGKNADLLGTIFQRLITDRRFLATFYTAPSSAALIARLMIGAKMPGGGDWSQTERIKNLRIADFACGTGTLLCALYAELRARVENAGVDSTSVHSSMMESALVGCDVVPSATYITASQLSFAFPTIQYKNTNILTMPFGRFSDDSVALGAFDLLEKQSALSTISTRASGVGAQSDSDVDAWKALGGSAVNDQSFDVIAMNPPFTRQTGGGGKSSEVSRPLFAAFGTSKIDQDVMAKRASQLFKGTTYHGNAGAGSAFVEIAHRKLKRGGRLGLILPISALAGISWEACRLLWREHYSDVLTVSIASDRAREAAFSADAQTAECMIVCTRSEKPEGRLVSVSLYRRPSSVLEGAEIGRRLKALIASKNVKNIEDGPFGGTPVVIGEEKVGEALAASIPQSGAWPLTRIRDHGVAQVAYQLINNGVIWLPGATSAQLTDVGFCWLGDLGRAGPYHLDISASSLSGGAPRGPFELTPTAHPQSVTFPALVAHDEKRERYLEILPDEEAVSRDATNSAVKDILQRRRDAIWATRTKLHISTDTQFNANALIACLTTRDAIGGRAWPSFMLDDRRFEKAITLWFNSTFGILAYWWLSSKSQDGRGSVTTTRFGDLLCFDPRTLSDADLNETDVYFESFKSKPLLDIHECVNDSNRAELDWYVVRHFLKAGAISAQIDDGVQLLRAKLAIEPSIAGGN